jgi:hypothetical protein
MPSRNLRELAEYHARESVRAAYLTNLSEYRETWLKVAQEWLDEARLLTWLSLPETPSG